jgi:hypothetical protein
MMGVKVPETCRANIVKQRIHSIQYATHWTFNRIYTFPTSTETEHEITYNVKNVKF